MKPVRFSLHAREPMAERGASVAEVVDVVRTGEQVPAKRGRQGFRKNFQYNSLWVERTYAIERMSLMKITCDPDVDALYVRFLDGAHQVTTQRSTEDVAVNYTPDGRIVGIEVLDASASVFPTSERTLTVQNRTPIAG